MAWYSWVAKKRALKPGKISLGWVLDFLGVEDVPQKFNMQGGQEEQDWGQERGMEVGIRSSWAQRSVPFNRISREGEQCGTTAKVAHLTWEQPILSWAICVVLLSWPSLFSSSKGSVSLALIPWTLWGIIPSYSFTLFSTTCYFFSLLCAVCRLKALR